MDTITRYADELMEYMDLTKIMLYITLGAIVITIIFHLVLKDYRFVKYLPGSVIVLAALYNLLTVFEDMTEKSTIKNLEMFLILAVAGFSSLFFALIIGIYTKPRKIRKKKKKVEKEGA